MINLVLVADADTDYDPWYPVDVEESITAHGYVWDSLGWYKPGQIGVVDHLDFPPDMHQPVLPPVGYHRVVPPSDDYPLWSHQFHLWRLYNVGPRALRGVGRHEGDWEMVQVTSADEACDQPYEVICAQHNHSPRMRLWTDCDHGVRDGRKFVRLYPALGSWAVYFTKGKQGGGDVCGGDGRHMTPEWRKFGAWEAFTGRMGNSSGTADSPRGPWRQARWDAHRFRSSAVNG